VIRFSVEEDSIPGQGRYLRSRSSPNLKNRRWNAINQSFATP
jgi:hypothetical protein